MTTQYTPILKLALPVTGELSGTWGDTVNDNITSMVEQAVAGLATISTWTGNSKTLTVANGTTSESRCAMLVAQTGSGGSALTGAGEIVCPAATKLYVLKNDSSFAITLKTSAGTGVAVAAGNTAFLFCDGTNVNACVTTIVDGRVTGNLTVDGNATINGNTTLGNATTDTITATARFNTDLLPSTDNARDLGSTANSWKDLYIDGTATMALVAISGGTINGVSIGGTTPATIINVDNLRLDGNTLSSTDTNGNVVIAPNGTGDVQLDADTVRVGDSGAAVTLASNGAGALTVTTGGAANLVLSTNSGTTSGTITINNGANGNIAIVPDGTGDVQLDADTVRIGDANTDVTLTTNGTGNLNLSTNSGTNSGVIQIAQGANGNITLTPNGTGSVSVPKLVWSNGTSGRVPYLTTGGQFTDSANMIFNGTRLTVADLADSGLTSGRVTYASTGGALVDSANMTFDGTTLTVNSLSVTSGTTFTGGTANGVAYLNGSKVLTTGSALTFDGTSFGVAGNAIISTTDNTNAALRITQLGTGNALLVEDSTNPDSSPFVVDANGNVISGNTTSVNAYGFANQLQLLSSTNAYQLNAAFRNDAFAPLLTIAHSRNGTIGSHTVLQSNDETGALVFAGSDGTQFIRTAQITSAVDGTPGTNDMPGRLVFSTTADGASSPTERARITSGGDLLVGTQSSSLTNSNSIIALPSAGGLYVQHASGAASGTIYIGFSYNGSAIGTITQNGTTAVLYNTTSDQRLKENITDADPASDLIDAIQVRQFDWKSDGSHQRYGMVAQELAQVAPEAVHQPADPEEMMAVDYSKLVPMLIKEVQALRARVAQLEAQP